VKIDVDDDASFSNVVVLLVLDGNFDDFTGTDILKVNKLTKTPNLLHWSLLPNEKFC